jgi:endonuclease/exonuclease/phosphatase family metal-dependent hydrolase
MRIFASAMLALVSITLLVGCGGSSSSDSRAMLAMDGDSAAMPAVALAAHSDLNSGVSEIVGRSDRLSVMSFNMHHRDRTNELSAIADDLRSRSNEVPDFILLQEVMFSRSGKKGETNSAAALATELEYYCRGTKRSSDREGVAIASRYPFLYYASRELDAQTSRLLLGFNRVSVMGEFNVPEVGRVRVVNVHLTNWGFEEHVRRQQLTETLQWTAARQREVPADVIIFGGDFNIEPDWDELDLMTSQAATGGIKYRSHNNPDSLTFGGHGDPRTRVDYIFIGEPGKRTALPHLSETCLWHDGVAFKRGNRTFYPSDHLPVVHEYRVPNVPPKAIVASAE